MDFFGSKKLTRAEKGPVAPPPALGGSLQDIVDQVASWSGVITTVHWHFSDHTVVDGVDFYVGEEELGHLHLDGSIHLATRPALASKLIEEGAAAPFRYQRGWVEAQAGRIGQGAAIDLFRRNYDFVKSSA